jgi:hypothetical protein
MTISSAEQRNGPHLGAVGPADLPLAGFGLQASGLSDATQAAMTRVRVYIDGFNLY